MPNRYVALLRGINVGGKNMLPMQDLAAIFTAASCKDVETYIQSGNVVFSAASTTARRVPDAVAAAITKRFGYRVPVILRDANELSKLASKHPLLERGGDAAALHVAFLAATPAAAQVAALDPKRSPPDVFLVRGRDVYLRLANGAGKTKLTNDYFDRTLGTTSTIRNWKTVQTLAELVLK